MTVPTQTALEVPQTGLGQALGLGLQKGGDSNTKQPVPSDRISQSASFY